YYSPGSGRWAFQGSPESGTVDPNPYRYIGNQPTSQMRRQGSGQMFSGFPVQFRDSDDGRPIIPPDELITPPPNTIRWFNPFGWYRLRPGGPRGPAVYGKLDPPSDTKMNGLGFRFFIALPHPSQRYHSPTDEEAKLPSTVKPPPRNQSTWDRLKQF